jgi:ribA/ribD-fused uncharacterized protein
MKRVRCEVVFQTCAAGKRFAFFWRPGKEPNGWLSNWSLHGFRDESDHFCATAEHYIMYRKALLMGDEAIAGAILKEASARKVKALGRKVSNWDEKVWSEHREEIMGAALRKKMDQNAEVQQWLEETEDATIAEASPYDKIWGIGIKSDHKNVCNPEKWPGKNLLGKMWMKVRDSKEPVKIHKLKE